MSAAAAYRTAAAVENTHINIIFPAHFAQGLLSLFQGPVGHPVASVFITVGVADHDFLKVVARLQLFLIQLILKYFAHQPAALLKIFDGLKKRYHIDGTLNAYFVVIPKPRFFGQDKYLQHITDPVGHTDDIIAKAVGIYRQHLVDQRKGFEHLSSLITQLLLHRRKRTRILKLPAEKRYLLILCKR